MMPSQQPAQPHRISVGDITGSDAVAIGSGAVAIKTGNLHVEAGGVLMLGVDGRRIPVRSTPEVTPAQPGETVALIAQFDGHGQTAWKIEERIYRAINDAISRLVVDNLRVARVRNVVVESGDDAKAREIASACGAAMIIWGWYDEVGFTPRLTMTAANRVEGEPADLPEVMVDAGDRAFRHYMFRGLADELALLATLAVGQLLYWDRRYTEALAAFDRAIAEAQTRQEPQLALAHFYRGFILATRQHDVASAAAAFERAGELDPGFAQAHYNLADARCAQLRYKDAILAYTRALQANPGHLFALIGRGNAHLEAKRYDRAIEDFTAALNIRPWTRIYLARAQAFERSGRRKLAQGDYYRARELDPFCDTAKERLKPPRYRGEGKLRSAHYDLEHAPGPTFVASYETALRILGRATPPATQTEPSEDAEAVELARCLAEIENHTVFAFEAIPTPEQLAYEEAGARLPFVLLTDGPDLTNTEALLNVLYRSSPQGWGVRDLIHDLLTLPTLQVRFGTKMLAALKLSVREGTP
ncbi:tetratricopeptide repeat protein [Asanoa sp. NPDC049518]|uniref:tetratricopeptide repeat protein n=1 Tax=unclassified Asanoa TaxID=2685164 RepID=UPI00342367F9